MLKWGACDSSMVRITSWGNRTSVYWWTPERAEIKKNSLRLWRKAQRTFGSEEDIAVSAEHKAARKNANKRSKLEKWRNLIKEVGRWGSLGPRIQDRYEETGRFVQHNNGRRNTGKNSTNLIFWPFAKRRTNGTKIFRRYPPILGTGTKEGNGMLAEQ